MLVALDEGSWERKYQNPWRMELHPRGRVENLANRNLVVKPEKTKLRGGLSSLIRTMGEPSGEKRQNKQEWDPCMG